MSEPKDYNIDTIDAVLCVMARHGVIVKESELEVFYKGVRHTKAYQEARQVLFELITKKAEIYPEKGIGSLKAVRAVPLEVIERLFNIKEK